MGKIKDRYAIVGVGESERSRNSGTTPLHMALDAARAALNDAGLEAKDIDGFMNYNENDSCTSHQLATYLGVRPKYVKDIQGGGSSTEMLIGDAIGLIEAGMLNTVLIFRSMNGSSGQRVGRGYDPDMLQSALPGGSYIIPYGSASPSQWFGMFATRHMYETGITKEHLGHVCLSFYEHAQRNPKAFLHGKPLTMEKYLETPDISYPFNIHDSCVELDEANAIIVTSAERANDCKSKPVYIMGMEARQCHPNAHYWADLNQVASDYVGENLFHSAGVKPEDMQVASIYDCFSWVVLRQLEAYGLAPKGEVGEFVAEGNLRMDGKLPTNTAGGMLSEGYTHGMNNVLEIVRQLRHEYKGSERQVKDCEIGICTGWSGPDIAGAMILRN
ncbi:thiolase C-terminal domain-containing protein [Virgibacillus halodenitrificans]|uniref:Thiolase n=1 Tax=Virgibacillus halodenitrificans TaxID=1482 RepID=A0ABR7VV77_VIRHA|nr:thiolase [Virgibacillus halodenitrificans]MBD1224359.1 thiolase [Virgibacillus halodenitrificans]MYL60456.1 thiolase [Virgibacillus halodenitrificans]WHX26927.1 thiolase [Virgibacillus halodenitrificans]